MKRIFFMIKSTSSLCNLHFHAGECRFLFDTISDDSAIDAKVIFAFQGGKPMLAELSYYKQFCAKLNVLKSYTEGELYDLDKWYFTL